MRYRQLSIATAMAAVAYLAIGFAALRSPTHLWVNTMFSLAIALLAVSVLGAIFRHAFWLGILVVGGGYLLLAVGPWVGERFGPRLVTTTVLIRVFNGRHYNPKEQYEDVWWWNNKKYDSGYITDVDDRSNPPKYTVLDRDGASYPVHPSRFRPIDPESYWILGHSFVCPILGCLGGIVAQKFAGRGIREGQARVSEHEQDRGTSRMRHECVEPGTAT